MNISKNRGLLYGDFQRPQTFALRIPKTPVFFIKIAKIAVGILDDFGRF